MKIAQVKFLEDRSREVSTKKYSYFTDLEDLFPGDEVVVETRYGIKVAIFQNFIPETKKEAELASAWIIQKVDYVGLDEKKEKLKRLKTIKTELLERKSKIEERQIFEIMARTDEKMAALLKEFDNLLEGK